MSDHGHPVPAPREGKQQMAVQESMRKVLMERIQVKQTNPQNPLPPDIKAMINGTK